MRPPGPPPTPPRPPWQAEIEQILDAAESAARDLTSREVARIEALIPDPSGVCRECHTEGPYDEHLTHLRVCYWCAELQRLNPHPILPDPTPDPARSGLSTVPLLVLILGICGVLALVSLAIWG